MPDQVGQAGSNYNDFLMNQPFSKAGGFPQVFNLGGNSPPLVGFTVANPAGGAPVLSPYFSTHVAGLPGYNPGALPVSRPNTTLGADSSGTPGHTGPTLGSALTSPYAFLPQHGGMGGGGGGGGGMGLGGVGSPGIGPGAGFMQRYGGVEGFANAFGGGGGVGGGLAPQGFALDSGAAGFTPNFDGMNYPNYVGAGGTNIYSTPLPYGQPNSVFSSQIGAEDPGGGGGGTMDLGLNGGDPDAWFRTGSNYATPGLAPFAQGMSSGIMGGGGGPTDTTGVAASGGEGSVSGIAHTDAGFQRGGAQAGDWFSKRSAQGVVGGQGGGPLTNQQDLDFLLENGLVDQEWADVLSGVVTDNEESAKKWAEALRN